MRALLLVVAGLVVGCSADSEGPPGPEGPAGERGNDGAPGLQGERGPLGPPGDRGPLGDQGRRGEDGERGERGEQGVPGPAGSVGIQGPPGPSGADGTSCFGESTPDGFLITCGEETLVLRHGEDGEPGEPGSPGAMGVQGPQGSIGEIGLQGERGEIGPRGEQGPIGPEGPPGQDGISCVAQDVLEGIQIACGNVSVLIRHGEHGPQGERGEPGPLGQDGEPGSPGLQGEVGPIGPAGPHGEPGEQGFPGNTLHLFDASGQDLGIIISMRPPVTYLSGLDLLASFSEGGNFDQGPVVDLDRNQSHLWFGGPNCTGQMYVEGNDVANSRIYQSVVQIGNPDVGYYKIASGRSVDLPVSSNWNNDSWPACEILEPRDQRVLRLLPIEPVVLPFNEPLAWPLKVGIVQ